MEVDIGPIDRPGLRIGVAWSSWRRLAIIAALVAAMPAAAADRDAERLRSLDLRLATIAFRLTTANAGLCREQAPATGLVLHALGQYLAARRNRVRAAFGFEAPVAVEAVVPGSPAETAGVGAGDSLIAIDAEDMVSQPSEMPPTTAARDAALAVIAAHPAGNGVVLRLRRTGAERAVVLHPVTGCAVTVEAVPGIGLGARADAHGVQVGIALLARLDDAGVAAVTAHELAHVILGHHDRLVAAGRRAALVRQTEDEADALSPALLYNAGYDPDAATRLWRTRGSTFERGSGGLHGSAAERAAITAAAAAAIPAGAPRPWRPPSAFGSTGDQ